MKYIFIVLLVLTGFVVQSQQRFPTGVPTQLSTGWFRQGYHQSDSGTIVANRDTTWKPKFSGTVVFRPTDKRFYYFDSTVLVWYPFFVDTISLSNRINLKLSISDTSTMLLPYLRKADTLNKWVNNIRRLPGSLNVEILKNGAWTTAYIDSISAGGGGAGTVTSVALSMPSAFTVTGSPITTSGTFAISVAGTTLQYIRGNGTLATTDTGMIPNFHLKVRGLLSGTSPITFNQTTGTIGINNANTSGIKGAATFNSSSFSDNGGGLISLNQPVPSGTCINCDITWGADGRPTSYASGTPPQFVNASGAGDTLSISDTLKRLNNGYGVLHVVTANNITHSIDTSSSNSLVTQYDLTQLVLGINYKFASSALTGIDTTKYWIKTPSTAAVYNVYTRVNGSWERFGWLDSVSNVFSTKKPITILVCGQSNAAGIGSGGDTSYMKGIIAFGSASGNGTSSDYQTIWKAARIQQSPFYSSNNNIAFQVAKQLKKNGDADIVRIITTYEGGTSLASWIGGGNKFLLDTLRTRLNRSGIDTIDMFCWHQGESGGITGFTLGGYVVDQRVLYDSLTSSLTKGFFRNYTKYVAGGPADTAFYYTPNNRGAPFMAQMGLDFDGNFYTGFASSKGLTNTGDNVHFTGTSLDSLGKRYYAALKLLPHSTYEENPPFGWDSAYDKYNAYETLTQDYTGGSGAYKKIGAGFGWKTNALNRLFTLSPSPASGTVFIGEPLGYANTIPKMLQINGNAAISGSNFNCIIAGGWNVTDVAEHNVVVANYSADFNQSAGSESVLIGYNPGYTSTSHMPFNSVVIGSDAGKNNVSANFNTYIGRQSGENVTGLNNTFIGARSGRNSGGSGNTSLGTDAGALNSTARTNSTAIGFSATYNEDSVFVAGANLKKFYMGTLDFRVNVTPTNGQYFAWDSTTSQFELTSASSVTTLYTGDGAIAGGNRTVTGGANGVTYTSVRTGLDATMNISNTSSGYGLRINTSGAGIAIEASSSTGYGGNISSTSGPGLQVSTGGNTALIAHVNPSSTNSVHQGISLARSSTGIPAAGEGVSFDFENETSVQLRTTTQLISKLTDVTDATRTSQFEIWGVNSGVLQQHFTVKGTSQIQLNGSGYTGGTFTGTAAFNLAVDASGNVIVVAAAHTFNNGLTNTSGTVKLGGALTGTTDITGSQVLNLGTSPSPLASMNIFSNGRLGLFSGITYDVDANNTDANYTVAANTIIVEVTDNLTANRTLTLPTASVNGQSVTLLMRFSAGANKYSLSAAVTDNATGTTFTQLDWGKTYDFMVDQGIQWRLIRKY